MFTKHTKSLTLAVIVLAGCATADTYRNTPTAKLCIDYLTLPSVNINHGARAEELSRRGENCNDYMGAASARRAADNAFENSLRSMQQLNQPQPVRTPVQTQCYRNGAYVNCTSYENI
jgi:hypothetical protein